VFFENQTLTICINFQHFTRQSRPNRDQGIVILANEQGRICF